MGTAGSSLEARVGECEQPARLPCSLKEVPSTWHPLGGAGLGTTSTSSNVSTSISDLLFPRELLRGNFEVRAFKQRQPRLGRQRLVSERSSTSPHSLQKYCVSWTLVRSCSRRWAGGCVSASGGSFSPPLPTLCKLPPAPLPEDCCWLAEPAPLS